LYATFLQIDLGALPRALGDRRFLGASIVANFVLVPVLVTILVAPLRSVPGVQLGAAMVLLAPCTDWFASFTHLGGGDVRRAVAITPLLLLLQLALLPVYLSLIVDGVNIGDLEQRPFVIAFVAVILVPLLLALTTRALLPAATEARWTSIANRALPLLLAAMLLLVAASQAPAVRDADAIVARAGVIFVAYAVLALWLARMVARVVSLDQPARRTLAFNLGTRNSFVVLPLALALPAHLSVAAAVIALQSLIELAAMVAYLYAVPAYVFPDGGFEDE
jgi:arsenite transporter